MSSNIDKFLGLLNMASAVTVDDGAMLTGIVAEKIGLRGADHDQRLSLFCKCFCPLYLQPQ